VLAEGLTGGDLLLSGTSSKSTKMLHGGVRYLEKAFTELDFAQLSLVTEALHERATVIKIAPYLCWEWVAIVYRTWDAFTCF
jgi:glycerol-3-phosphate dehydrogenase